MKPHFTKCPGCNGALGQFPKDAMKVGRPANDTALVVVCSGCHSKLLECGSTGKYFEATGRTLVATGNDLEIAKISRMSETELLDFVMQSPEFLTDSCYRVFGNALEARYAELLNRRTE